MNSRLWPVFAVVCLTACAGRPVDEVQLRSGPPAGCDKIKNTWKLKVVLGNSGPKVGAPVDVAPDRSAHPNLSPESARALVVRPCDVVRFEVGKQGSRRSAMVVFDKAVETGSDGRPQCVAGDTRTGSGFRSPGRSPAYLTRTGFIEVPIDQRAGAPEKDAFCYTVRADCPDDDVECPALDPMIIVER